MISYLAFILLVSQSAEDAAREMKNIWSPYCKGISLMECPSSQAETLRNEVYDRTKAGENFETIYADLQKRFGSGILRMSPDTFGREGLSYWIPWAMLLMAVLFVGLYWKLKPKRKSTASKNKAGVDKTMAERIERDLQERLNS